jgi:hypothetical protein
MVSFQSVCLLTSQQHLVKLTILSFFFWHLEYKNYFILFLSHCVYFLFSLFYSLVGQLPNFGGPVLKFPHLSSVAALNRYFF